MKTYTPRTYTLCFSLTGCLCLFPYTHIFTLLLIQCKWFLKRIKSSGWVWAKWFQVMESCQSDLSPRKFASYPRQQTNRYAADSRLISRLEKLQRFTWNKISQILLFFSIEATWAMPWGQTYHYNLAVQTLPPAASTGVLTGRKSSKVKKQSARGHGRRSSSSAVQKT